MYRCNEIPRYDVGNLKWLSRLYLTGERPHAKTKDGGLVFFDERIQIVFKSVVGATDEAVEDLETAFGLDLNVIDVECSTLGIDVTPRCDLPHMTWTK
jgi:hypothetical protein